MAHVFYFIGLLYLIKQLATLLSPIEKSRWFWKFSDLTKAHKGLKWDDYTEEYKDMCKSAAWSLLFLVWAILGLFSSINWVMFVLYLFLQFIIFTPLYRILRKTFAYIAVLWIAALLNIIFVLFVVINAYHLRMDMWALLKPYIGL
jgi:hypothetical protein